MRLTFEVFVLHPLKKFAADYARVPLRWLVNLKRVIIQVEGDDEFSANVLWFVCVEDCVESQLNLVIYPLEIVFLDWLWLESEAVSKGVLLITEVVVRRDLTL